MKQALIAPMQPVEAGYRVAEVCDTAFEVAPPLFWVECADDIVADQYWYDPSNQTFNLVPVPEPTPVPVPPGGAQPTVTGTQTL